MSNVESVIALAGRRIDPADSTIARFPLANLNRVRDEIRLAMTEVTARAIVCSAACGADLLALEVAGQLGLEQHVVLPYSVSRFRTTSVVDRPGPWGAMYDDVIAKATATARLIRLQSDLDETEAYSAATARIIAVADQLSRSRGSDAAIPVALLVWDGKSRGARRISSRRA